MLACRPRPPVCGENNGGGPGALGARSGEGKAGTGAVLGGGGEQRVLPRPPLRGGLAYKGSPVPDVFVHSHGVVHDWRNRTDRTWHNQSQHTASDLGKYITCSHGEGGENNKKKVAKKVATATGSGILGA